MKNQELAKRILELVGGKENIDSAYNCMTRLRIRPKDRSKVQLDELKRTEGILGVVDADTLQIVVGPGKAKRIGDIFVEEFGIKRETAEDCKDEANDWRKTKQDIKARQSKGPVKAFLETIAGIFIPLLPAIIAAGLFNGLASLIGTLIDNGRLAGDFWTILQLLFALTGSAFLGYFAIYTGINAAKRFGATEALGGMIGAMTIGAQINTISSILGLYNEDTPLESILTTGKGGIIGVIIGVYILAKVERFVRRFIPEVVDLLLTPLLSLLITGILLVLIIMPISGFLSDILVSALSVIIDSDYAIVRILSGYILAAVFLPMVLLGLHHGLIPIYAIQLETTGGVSLFPVLAMAGAGQVGAALAIYFKAKRVNNERLQSVITGALPAGILGIGEPLIYGVTLPLGKPFITAGLGAGFGGAWIMLSKVTASGWGPSGLVALPLMQPGSMLNYFIGILISYAAGFIITHFFIHPSIVEKA